MAKSVLESWLTSSEKRTTRSGFDGKETIRTLHAHESGTSNDISHDTRA